MPKIFLPGYLFGLPCRGFTWLNRIRENRPDDGGRRGEYRFREEELFSSPPLCRMKTAALFRAGNNLIWSLVFGELELSGREISVRSYNMSHLRPRFAGNQAVRAFLAEIGALYFGVIYDHKRGEGKIAWESAVKFLKGACVYCGTPTKNLPKNTSMTVEHLFENNQFSVGLHHPGNTVPACAKCNHSRHGKKGDERTAWQEHLAARCMELGHGAKVAKRRQERIEKYLFNGPNPYPRLSNSEKAFLRESCAALYQEAMMLCAPRVQQFRAIAKIKPRKVSKTKE